jgi:hypothetical protein
MRSLKNEENISYRSNPMELSPIWEAASLSGTQEFHNILLNVKVHHGVQKSRALAHILSYMNPVHSISTDFSNVHLNINLPSTSTSF